jgi:hypothetical protein
MHPRITILAGGWRHVAVVTAHPNWRGMRRELTEEFAQARYRCRVSPAGPRHGPGPLAATHVGTLASATPMFRLTHVFRTESDA